MDHTKLFENVTGNQCHININAWQILRKKKNVGESGKGMTTSFLCYGWNMVDSVLSCFLSFITFFVCDRVHWLYQYCSGRFMLFVVLCPGTPEGSTGSGSGFKAY